MRIGIHRAWAGETVADLISYLRFGYVALSLRCNETYERCR